MKKLLGVCLAGVFALFTVAPVWAQFTTPNNPSLNPTAWGNSQNVSVVGAGVGQQDAFVNVVKWAINWLLWILALIALVILLYGGFLMVTAAGNDDQYNKWFTILKHAAFGLVMIGIAWFIVSIIFWVINLVTTSSDGQPAGTATQ